jgi:MoaA/NifB/PqqE/SkfB family radical SAM enzyme
MISYLDIHKKKRLNIDIGVRCTLQCHDCSRTIMMNRGQKIPGKDLTLAQFDKISNFFKDGRIDFCGWWSDPIFNPKFIDMLEICEVKNITPVIHTAASHKPEKWYIEAFTRAPKAVWRFGIDGLPKNSHRYRVNQDGEKLFNIMLLAQSMNITVQWQYIVFDYNKKHVSKAKKIAADLKIPILFIETTRDTEIKKVLYKTRQWKRAKTQ